MKGYKGFHKGMVCRGKQYAENTVFEEKHAEICREGMHFCKEPFDVLDYYEFVNDNGELNEFAEVEALDEVQSDDNRKYCTTKLRVGAKLSFAGFVKACIECVLEKTSFDKASKNNHVQIGSSGHGVQIASSGNGARIASSGYGAQIGSSGNGAQIGSSGNTVRIASSGYGAQIGSSGYGARIASSGYGAQIGSSGYGAQIGSSGYGARIASSGYGARIASSGYGARIASSGYGARIASSGYGAQIGSSGYGARIASSGKHCVICCAGSEARVKAKRGSWITLSEWEDDEGGNYVPVCVKTEFVDGERIKEDTYYRLVNGEFEKCEE